VTAPRRTYTKRQKAEIVGQAEVAGVRPASRKAHVPESTIRYWRESEQFAQLRAEKREDVAQDVWAGFQMGVRRIAELMGQTEDMAKVAIATGVLFDKFALMSGEATSRSETRTLIDGMDDHERELLSEVLRRATEVEA
jgi:transposase-like protein